MQNGSQQFSQQGSELESSTPHASTPRGFTLWLTGMSGSGKSTLTERVSRELALRGLGVEVLDGDVVRTHLSRGLSFSKEDRDINVRRIGWVCSILARHGVVTLSAAISPYADVRHECRLMTEASGAAFVEVFCRASLETLIERDVKGLYKKALAGEIQNFTGVSDPYEAPQNPDVLIESDRDSVEDSVQKILTYLEERQLISSTR